MHIVLYEPFHACTILIPAFTASYRPRGTRYFGLPSFEHLRRELQQRMQHAIFAAAAAAAATTTTTTTAAAAAAAATAVAAAATATTIAC